MPYDSNKNVKENYKDSSGYKGKNRNYKKETDELAEHLKDLKTDVYSPLKVKKEIVVSSRLVQRMDEDKIKPLKLVSSEIIGGIFDRVNFLRSRITDLRSNIDLRKQIHADIAREIDNDIDDRNSFLHSISDINERRNLKLDISVLRKERRHEDVQFWRDLVELMEELKTQEEAYEIEMKIAGIFGNNGEV